MLGTIVLCNPLNPVSYHPPLYVMDIVIVIVIQDKNRFSQTKQFYRQMHDSNSYLTSPITTPPLGAMFTAFPLILRGFVIQPTAP